MQGAECDGQADACAAQELEDAEWTWTWTLVGGVWTGGISLRGQRFLVGAARRFEWV
jgi:hypothetical protein